MRRYHSHYNTYYIFYWIIIIFHFIHHYLIYLVIYSSYFSISFIIVHLWGPWEGARTMERWNTPLASDCWSRSCSVCDRYARSNTWFFFSLLCLLASKKKRVQSQSTSSWNLGAVGLYFISPAGSQLPNKRREKEKKKLAGKRNWTLWTAWSIFFPFCCNFCNFLFGFIVSDSSSLMRRGGGHEIYCAPGPFRVNS